MSIVISHYWQYLEEGNWKNFVEDMNNENVELCKKEMSDIDTSIRELREECGIEFMKVVNFTKGEMINSVKGLKCDHEIISDEILSKINSSIYKIVQENEFKNHMLNNITDKLTGEFEIVKNELTALFNTVRKYLSFCSIILIFFR